MAQTDCVVLPLADAAVIRAVRLAPASLAFLHGKTVIQMGTIAQEESLPYRPGLNESADRIAKRRCWSEPLRSGLATLIIRPPSRSSTRCHSLTIPQKLVAGSRVLWACEGSRSFSI